MDQSKALKWLRFNLFARPFDIALSLMVTPVLIWLALAFLTWTFQLADWDVVRKSVKVLMTGMFPSDQIWRAWIAAASIAFVLGLANAVALPLRPKHLPLAGVTMAGMLALTLSISFDAGLMTFGVFSLFLVGWIATTRSALVQAHAGKLAVAVLVMMVLILTPAGPSTWGGLLLSVVLTVFSAALTIPLGILLAFGRQSKVGSIRTLSTGYIETMRAVPLILIVYWIWIAQPLLLPALQVPDVVRGLIGFVIFYSAYAAEYIRSGLQAVPRGQIEAAQALGMSDTDIKRIVVLPQAMRVALPGLVGNTLDIFNYAPLVFIIGLTDFLRAGQMVLANPQNSGQTYEIYVFLFAVYFAIGSIITFLARRIEKRLGKGAQR